MAKTLNAKHEGEGSCLTSALSQLLALNPCAKLFNLNTFYSLYIQHSHHQTCMLNVWFSMKQCFQVKPLGIYNHEGSHLSINQSVHWWIKNLMNCIEGLCCKAGSLSFLVAIKSTAFLHLRFSALLLAIISVPWSWTQVTMDCSL